MIERLYLRELLAFDEVELEFEKGLVVLTGPSGAGKSVLMSAILSAFGYTTQSAASVCEVSLRKPEKLDHEAYELGDELTIKTVKKENLRYFIEGQNISKKTLQEMFTPYVNYLSVRDRGGFESEMLLGILDAQLASKDKTFKQLLKEYKKRYQNYKQKALQLSKIKEDESKVAELIEFATYEIKKIVAINPRVGEEEELLKIKQHLSRMDKIKEALSSATGIFALEGSIEEVYRLLDKDASFFGDAMNQLRADFEETEALADELDEVNVEEVLDRLSDLTSLKNRYGSIEEALQYKEAKEKELLGYQNSEKDKSMLESFLALEFSELTILASKLSQMRQQEALVIEERLAVYLRTLKLPALHFVFSAVPLDVKGKDSLDAQLGTSKTSTLSGGEFNRVRLALLASTIPSQNVSGGVLILDEIDANVSGDESIAIADMIHQLSSAYQIFAISHQPHLSAKAHQHLVVSKTAERAKVEVLDDAARIVEIARIIAGEKPTAEAVEFAKKLRAH